MVAGDVGGKRRRSWTARVLSVLSAAALVVTMSLVAAPAASAAGLPDSYAASQRKAAPGVTVWHQPRLTKLAAKARAMTRMHIPYSSGGHGARPAKIGQSVDCSGLVRQLYHYAFGVDIGRGTGDSMVRTSGKFARTSHPVPGDVVLIGHGGRGPAYHAMVYVGRENGQPLAVGSPTWGEQVKYQHPSSGYWSGQVMGYWHFKGADRLDSARSTKRPSTKVGVWKVTSGNGTEIVEGWAYDPINPGRSVTVDVYASGKRVARVTANKPSPGVDKDRNITGRHRFSVHVPLSAGPHPTRVLAHNIGYDRVRSAWSGQRHVTVRKRTVAVLSSVTTGVHGRHGTLRVTGYGYDSFNGGTAPRVQVLVDGRVASTLRTYQSSTDFNRARQLSGRHRFGVTIAAAPGHHTVQLRTLKVNKYSVVGHSRKLRSGFVKGLVRSHYDSLTAKDSRITVRGWAFPPFNTSSDVTTFTLTLDGRTMPTVRTTTYRPDVNRHFHIKGRHGLSVGYTVRVGKHTVCLKPNAMSPQSFGVAQGCKSVTVRK